VCAFFIEHKITDAMLEKMTDEDIIQLLTGIKGVGRWTVEMILMFAMGRSDVFAVDDLGIQQQMSKIYGIDVVNNNGKVGGGTAKYPTTKFSKIIGDSTTDTAKEFYNTCVALGFDKFIIFGGNYFIEYLYNTL
jgi:hypothetical protein